MRAGFSFKGQHSNAFGWTVKTNDRPVRPETKETTYNPTNADGEHSFAKVNPQGHEYYEDKVFQIEINVSASSLSDLQRQIIKLSRWIMGEGELIFDDTPFVRWTARIIDTVQYMPENDGTKAKFIVKYRVKPFSELVFDTIDGPCIDDEIELNSDLPLNIGEFFTFTGAGSYIVKNIGDVPVKPLITVTGVTKSCSIECNGFKLTVPKNAVIDCERYIVMDLFGNSLMSQISGDFFELAEGDNVMTITSDENINVTMQYQPKYIHSIDMREMGFE